MKTIKWSGVIAGLLLGMATVSFGQVYGPGNGYGQAYPNGNGYNQPYPKWKRLRSELPKSKLSKWIQ